MHLTRHLLMEKFRDAGEAPKLHLFGQLRRITQEWFTSYFSCKGGTTPAQLLYKSLADTACTRIEAAITRSCSADKPVRALLDSYNPQGSTSHVNFTTSKKDRWQTDPRKCHINWIINDSDWEAEFCRVAEAHPKVKAYVKNQNLGFEVPYTLAESFTITCRTSYFWLMTATGKKTSCILSWKSRATAEKTQKKRNPPWRPTGFRASTI